MKSLRLKYNDTNHTCVVFFVKRKDDSILYRDLEKKAIECISDNVVYPTTGGDVRTLGLPNCYENILVDKVNSCWEPRRNIPFVPNRRSQNWERIKILNSGYSRDRVFS